MATLEDPKVIFFHEHTTSAVTNGTNFSEKLAK